MRTTLLWCVASALLGCSDDARMTSSSTSTDVTTTTTTTVVTTTVTTTTTTATTPAQTETATVTTTTGTTTAVPKKVCQGRKVGTQLGQCGEDFTLLDHTKTPISLYDYAGDIILLDMSGFT